MLSIVIVTFNGMPWLKKCLDSCRGYNVIVVDNASTDGTLAFIQANYPQVKLLPQNKNLGFGQANNLGMSQALNQGAEHVFLLNQDAYLIDDCLDLLVSKQKENPEYGILSPIHTNGHQDKLDENFSNYLAYKNNSSFYSDFVLGNKLKQIYDTPFVNAAAWLLSKKTLMSIGGFDPLFFHYGEDVNYCQRVSYHQFKIGVIPTTFVIHDREHRIKPQVSKFTQEYFKNKARTYSLKFADVSLDTPERRIDSTLRKLSKAKIKALFRLKFTMYNGYLSEQKMLLNLKPLILSSYSKNKTTGKHYIH